MTLDATLIPVDPVLDQKIKLWLAAPEADKFLECLGAEARQELTQVMNEYIHADIYPKGVMDHPERVQKIRHLRDCIETLRTLRKRTNPFCTLQYST